MSAKKVKKKKELKPVIAEDFYELTFAADPQISPDGKTVAYVARTAAAGGKRYRNAVWVCGSQGARQFTAGQKQDHSPRWSPDGKHLAFVSNRNGTPQLWLIPLNGGEARALTHLPNGAMNPVWAPDGCKLLFTSRINEQERAQEDKRGVHNQPLSDEEREKFERQHKKQEREKVDPRQITRTIYRAGTEFFDDRHTHIYVLDVGDGTVERLTREAYDHINPCWSPNGKSVYCAAKRTGDTDDSLVYDLLRIPSGGGRAKRLLQAAAWGLNPIPSPDGQHIAYLETPQAHASGKNAHLMMVPTTGKGARRLASSLDADFLQVAWSKDSQKVLFTSGQRGNVGLYAVSLKSDRIRQCLSGRRMIRGFSVAAQADRLAFLASTPASPCDLFTCDGRGNKEVRLTRLNDEYLNTHQVQPVEQLWYKSKDGTDVQGWVIKPAGFRADRKYPLALEIHGGPHAMWSDSETTMWHEWQLLASAGYVVFFCNPRGSDGYGEAFKDAIHEDWGTYPTQDILSGVDRLLNRGYIDPKRLCVTGGSYGGYMTAWLIGHDERFAAAVSQRGVYDLLSFFGTTDVPRLIEWEFDATPWEDPMRLWEASPLAYAERIHTPLLILHSERDFRAPIPTAEGLYMALRKLGRTVKFVRFPDEGHELSRSGQPKRLVSRLTHILDWFKEHAK